tara:strand:- start:402 stop:656 length:255 start_codon:yes stop_codon:yes gene_type:complete
MNKNKRMFIATPDGLCVKVYLDLKNNIVLGLQSGAIPFLRKLGWDIEKLKKRNYRKRKDINDLKRYRIFHHSNRIKKEEINNNG